MNGFFKDHGAERVAQGDLVAKVRRGLVASQIPLLPIRTHLYPRARILVSSLRLAKDLRTQQTDTWTQAQSDLILLFRACLATVLMSICFFVAREHELSVSLETYCVKQSVKSSSTTEREKVNAVLPRSENSFVSYRTMPTLT
jgi:hypothetical protein